MFITGLASEFYFIGISPHRLRARTGDTHLQVLIFQWKVEAISKDCRSQLQCSASKRQTCLQAPLFRSGMHFVSKAVSATVRSMGIFQRTIVCVLDHLLMALFISDLEPDFGQQSISRGRPVKWSLPIPFRVTVSSLITSFQSTC